MEQGVVSYNLFIHMGTIKNWLIGVYTKRCLVCILDSPAMPLQRLIGMWGSRNLLLKQFLIQTNFLTLIKSNERQDFHFVQRDWIHATFFSECNTLIALWQCLTWKETETCDIQFLYIGKQLICRILKISWYKCTHKVRKHIYNTAFILRLGYNKLINHC